jgi:hypothetical protein
VQVAVQVAVMAVVLVALAQAVDMYRHNLL